MQINVTQRDIDKGIKRSCALCPVARAVGRHFPRVVGREVNGHMIKVWPQPGRCLQAHTPPTAAKFITRFDADAGEAVKPFTFELNFFEGEP